MLKEENFYRIKGADGHIRVGQYMGRQKGFECCVCGKGCSAYTFNFYFDKEFGSYETLGYGREHLPQVLEDLGSSEEEALVDR